MACAAARCASDKADSARIIAPSIASRAFDSVATWSSLSVINLTPPYRTHAYPG